MENWKDYEKSSDTKFDNISLRKAVLSKQTTVFYEVKGKAIYLAYLHVNRKDIKKLK